MASPSPLLALPATLLSSILLHLTPHDLIPTLTLTTKHPSFRAFVEGAGPNEAALWTELLRQRLARFAPARAWFGLRSDMSWSKPMSDDYPACAQKAEVKLTAALEAGQVPEAQWEWEAEGLSHVNARRLLFVPASVSAGKTMADFRAWVETFTCTRCHRSGAATRQCAACGFLLCGDCAHGCDNEEDGCPFALCESHSYDVEVIEYMMQDAKASAPHFVSPSCPVCPPYALWCEAHAKTSFIPCSGCGNVRCADHRLFPGGMISMCSCGAYGCTRFGCRRPGLSFRLCGECFLQTCSDCEKRTPGKCRDCGGALIWNDMEEEEEGY